MTVQDIQNQREKVQMYHVVNHDQDLKFEQKLRQSDPEERQYLICIESNDPEFNNSWCIVNGRTAARDVIKDNIEWIKFDTSFVLVETLTMNDRVSIYNFMKHIEPMYPDDPFDIDEYLKGDWSESDFRKNNDIDPIFTQAQRLDMQSIMGGNFTG